MRSRRHAFAIALLLALASAGAVARIPGPAPALAVSSDVIALQSIETNSWPTVKITVVLPPQLLAGGRLTSNDFTVTENGAAIGGLKATSTSVTRRPLDVLLVLDSSGSMKGAALSAAQGAARALVAGLRPDDRVGLIGFSDHVGMVLAPTTDRASLDAAIGRLAAGGETALYDALARAAASLAATGDGHRAIVLLSDGGDTVSANTLGSAASALTSAGVPVYAVGLRTKEADQRALSTIARATGGRVVGVGGTSALAATFSGIARQLSSPYAITFKSLRPPAKDLEYTVVASARDARASLTAAIVNPDTVSPAAPTAPASLPGSAWPGVIALLVFTAIGALALAVLLLTRPEPNTLAQLRYYEQLRHGGARGTSAELDPESVQGRIVGLAGAVASKGGFDTAIRQALERAGLPLRPVEYMVIHSAIVLVLGGLVQLLAHNVLLTGVSIVLLAFGPVGLLQYLARKRTEAFQEQLPDVLNLLASSLRAGWGLQQAVGVVVTEIGPPAAPEFERVVTEARLGLPLEDALEKMAVRMESEDFKWAVSAIAIQREVGGNLAEVLDMVAATIRERAALRRQIQSLTAEGRLSAYILIALPFLEGTVLWMFNPGYFAPLLSSAFGLGTALLGLVLLAVGIVWLRNVIRIEV